MMFDSSTYTKTQEKGSGSSDILNEEDTKTKSAFEHIHENLFFYMYVTLLFVGGLRRTGKRKR